MLVWNAPLFKKSLFVIFAAGFILAGPELVLAGGAHVCASGTDCGTVAAEDCACIWDPDGEKQYCEFWEDADTCASDDDCEN